MVFSYRAVQPAWQPRLWLLQWSLALHVRHWQPHWPAFGHCALSSVSLIVFSYSLHSVWQFSVWR